MYTYIYKCTYIHIYIYIIAYLVGAVPHAHVRGCEFRAEKLVLCAQLERLLAQTVALFPAVYRLSNDKQRVSE